MRFSKKLCTFVALTSLISLSSCGETQEDWTPDNKIIVMYTSNLRGNLDDLSRILTLKHDFEKTAKKVFLVDTGNFLQGTKYTTFDGGKSLVGFMKEAEYDLVNLGSHDFDFGIGKIGNDVHGTIYEGEAIGKHLADNKLSALSTNVKTDDKYSFAGTKELKIDDENSVFFCGITDPDTVNLVNSDNLENIDIEDRNTTVSSLNGVLKASSSTYKICLTNNTNYDSSLINEADYVIGNNSEANYSLNGISIDEKGKILDLNFKDYLKDKDEALAKKIDEYKKSVDEDEGYKDTYKNEVTLNGDLKANRSKETNLGDFWTDALAWSAKENVLTVGKGEEKKNYEFRVNKNKIVAAWNGGNLRDYLNKGDITKKDIARVLPYPNKLAVVYLKGIELVEFLEAASYALPIDDSNVAALSSFMHVSGIEYEIDTSKEYKKGDHYGKYWYYDQDVGSRVTIKTINGESFNQEETYGLIVSNAVANGMDSNYVCNKEGVEKVIFNEVVRDKVFEFIGTKLNGKIGSTYDKAQSRITIK